MEINHSDQHPVLLDLGCQTSGSRSTPASHDSWSCSRFSPGMNKHLWRPRSADADHSHDTLIPGCVTNWYVILTFLRWLERSNKTTGSQWSAVCWGAEHAHDKSPSSFLNRKKLSFANFADQKPTPPSSIVSNFCSHLNGRNEAKMDPESEREALLHWS